MGWVSEYRGVAGLQVMTGPNRKIFGTTPTSGVKFGTFWGTCRRLADSFLPCLALEITWISWLWACGTVSFHW